MDTTAKMPWIAPTFAHVTEDNELFFQWRNGDRSLTAYFNPPDDEEGPFDCFGMYGGPAVRFKEFATLHEGYAWLVGPTEGD